MNCLSLGRKGYLKFLLKVRSIICVIFMNHVFKFLSFWARRCTHWKRFNRAFFLYFQKAVAFYEMPCKNS